MVSCKNVSYDNHLGLHFVQSKGWIRTVSVKTGHCTLSSRDLNEWQVTSMHSAPLVFHIGGNVWYKTVIQNDQSPFHYTTFLCKLFPYKTFTLQIFVLNQIWWSWCYYNEDEILYPASWKRITVDQEQNPKNLTVPCFFLPPGIAHITSKWRLYGVQGIPPPPPSFSPHAFSAKSIWRNKFLLGTRLLHLGQERQKGCTHRVGFEPTNLLIASREQVLPILWH